MRIYDGDIKKALNSVLLMLTPAEVDELIAYLRSLSIKNDHVHVDDADYKRMITIGLYTQENLQNFSPEVIKLIKEDE
jgi:hypothetical protein